MDISSYNMVLTGDDQLPLMEDNKILLWNNAVNACEYVELTTEVSRHFNLTEVEPRVEPSRPEENVVAKDEEHTGVPNTEDEGKFTWNHQSTLLLLDEYKSRYTRFRDPKIKKKLLWEEIARAMRLKKYVIDADSLDRKMRNMKNTYRTICDNNNKKKSTGKGRINWEYYTYFVDIFHDDKTVNLPTTILSSTIVETSNSSAELSIDTSGPSCSMSTLLTSAAPLSSPLTAIKTLSVLGTTPTSSDGKTAQANRLDKFRKRQLEIEEEKLSELKKIREGIDESNKVQKEKLELLKQFLKPTEK